MTTNNRQKNTTPQNLRQSPKYACYMKKKKWNVVRVPLTAPLFPPKKKEKTTTSPSPRGLACRKHKYKVNAFIKKLPLIGSVIKIQHPPAIPPEEVLDKLAKKHRALFIKIEPSFKIENLKLENSRFQRDTWPLLPTKTLRLDLKQSKKTLWNNLDSDAKYSIRRAKKRLKVKCEKLNKTDELKNFHQILKEAGKRQEFPTPSWQDLKNLAECFGEKGRLITTKISSRDAINRVSTNKVTAGCLLLLTHNQTAHYYHAATTKEGRSSLAGYLVLWEAIKLAKERGCRTFDFEGIYDDRYHKRTEAWKGFTYFKKKFGGKEVSYPHPIIKYYSLPIKAMAKLFG